MSERALTYRIDGNNRGGTLHADLLLKKIADRKHNLTVMLNDIEPGRARNLARRLAEHGIAASSNQGPAAPSPDADIHNVSVDSPAPVLPILQSAVGTPLLEVGQLVAPSSDGASVLGIAAVLNDSDPSKRAASLQIFSRLAALAGERRSSRVMSSPIRHSVQMAPVRRTMHNYLTDKSLQFMDRSAVPAELRLFDGLTHASYPAVTVEVSRHVKRRDLRGAAVNDLAPNGMGHNFCILYYDRAEAWLYIVFATRRVDRPRVVNSFEMPRVEPAPPSVDILRAWTGPAQQEQKRGWEILVTD